MEKQQARKHADVSPAGAAGGGGGCNPSSSGGSSSNTSNKAKKNNPLKKKEKDTELMGRPVRSELLNTDHEVFMQAFEKSTHIYRFLRTRNNLKPIFLHRNLTYMRNRMSRSHKSRQSFKIDSMLERKVAKMRSEQANGLSMTEGYLTLVFLGFFDEKNQTIRNGADSNGIVLPLKNAFPDEPQQQQQLGETASDCARKCVQVETNLLKIAHTKRKDAAAATQMQLTIGKTQVLVNPKEEQQTLANGGGGGGGGDGGIAENSAIVSIPTDSFNTHSLANHMSAAQVSFILRFRVQYTATAGGGPGDANEHYLTNGTVSDGEEPSAKRQKLHGYSKLYSTELTVCDKYGRCLLKEADYELAVREIISHQKTVAAKYHGSPMKNRYWSSMPEAYELMDFMATEDCSKSDILPPTSEDFIDRYEEMIKPILKVRLQWTKEPPRCYETGGAEMQLDGHGYSDKENHKPPSLAVEPFRKALNININNNSILTPAAAAAAGGGAADLLDDVEPSTSPRSSAVAAADSNAGGENTSLVVAVKPNLAVVPSNGGDGSASGEAPKRVIYHFIHNNYSRQRTENRSDYTCPWCSLNCGVLYSLLKHLRLSHARLNFTYVPIPEGARIDVTINEQYDGSYNGSPHDLLGPTTAYTVRDPLRRTVVTNLLVCRPRRPKPSLSEFIDNDENEFDSQRPYITGHSRLYHHTMTCLPVYPRELDIDSEGESDPLWLQQKTMQMIDEFTDVNEGEKELMKMWNLHVMKYGYVGDCQIPVALEMFIDLRGRELMARNLYRNFVLHMCSLFDFGLVSPDVMQRIIRKLRKIPANDTELHQTLRQARTEQMEYWNNVTVHKPQTIKTEHRNGSGERTAGAGASTSISGSSSYQHHKSSHGVGGSGSTTTGDGQQRKVKPTITPAKNTDPGAELSRRRRSGASSNTTKGTTAVASTSNAAGGSNGSSSSKATSSGGASSSHSTAAAAAMLKPPSSSGSGRTPPSSSSSSSSSPSAAASKKSSSTKLFASPTALPSTSKYAHNHHNHPTSMFSPIMTRRKSLSLGSNLLLRKRSLN